MIQYHPNKEIIRRICTIFKCNSCWLLNDSGVKLSILVNIKSELLPRFKEELESWSGCPFSILNNQSSKADIKNIRMHGEKLLPIENNTAMEDVEKRRRQHHKN